MLRKSYVTFLAAIMAAAPFVAVAADKPDWAFPVTDKVQPANVKPDDGKARSADLGDDVSENGKTRDHRHRRILRFCRACDD